MTKSQHLTSIEAIEKAALELIAAQGFGATTVDEIAAAAGIGRRTFFRYFASKNDIPFGDYESLLKALDEWLSSVATDRPILDTIEHAVMHFNRIHTDGPIAHRERMRLVMHTRSLRANAALRQDEWVAILARYAGRCLDASPDALGPQLIAQVSLGATNAAYEQWLNDESSDLADLVHQAFSMAWDPASLVSSARG